MKRKIPATSIDWDLLGYCPYPSEVYVEDRQTHTFVLGPDGEPYEYLYDPVGFDLRPRAYPDAD